MEVELNTGNMDSEMEEEICIFPTLIIEEPDINIQNCNNCTINITLINLLYLIYFSCFTCAINQCLLDLILSYIMSAEKCRTQ